MSKTLLKLGVSLVIGAFFIWLAIRGVDLDEVSRSLAGVDLGVVGLYVLLFGVVHVSRIFRWGILIKPIAKVSFMRLFTVGSVGFMALMLLPLRLGEFARPILIAEKGQIRISAALATIVVERVFDALAMAGLLVGMMFFLEGRVDVPGDLRVGALIVLVGFLGLLAFLMLAYWRQDATVDRFQRLLKPFSEKVALRLASTLRSFIGGLRALPNLRLLGAFTGMTFVFWGLNGCALWLMFGAFEELAQLGALEAFTALSVLCVGLMIPAGPGMIGNFHYFLKLGLSLFLADAVLGSSGVAYTILVHAIQLALHVVFGVACLFSKHISIKRAFSASASDADDGADAGSGQAV